MDPRSSLRTYGQAFAPIPSSVGWARRLSADRLKAWGVPQVIDDVQVILSELLTNSINHLRETDGGQPPTVFYPALVKGNCVRLCLTLDRDVLTIEAWDPSPKPPVMSVPDCDDETGRGLPIVQMISHECGWYWVAGPNGEGRCARGKVVWAKYKIT